VVRTQRVSIKRAKLSGRWPRKSAANAEVVIDILDGPDGPVFYSDMGIDTLFNARRSA